MKWSYARRVMGCLLVVAGIVVGAGAQKAYDYQKLKAAGQAINKDGEIVYWIDLTSNSEGKPQEYKASYFVVNSPVGAGDPPRKFVNTTGLVRGVRPNNSSYKAVVFATPKDDGTIRNAAQAGDEDIAALEMYDNQYEFLKKYGTVKLKDGWMVSSSKVPVTPPSNNK